LRATRGPDFSVLEAVFQELDINEEYLKVVLHELQSFLEEEIVNAVNGV
jgi:hypothetical protein